MDELNKLIAKLPESLKYKDGDEIVECGLTFFFRRGANDAFKWAAAYYCTEHDYFLMCGYGSTIYSAALHLKRLIADYRRHRGDGYVPQ